MNSPTFLDKNLEETNYWVIFQDKKIILQENDGKFFLPSYKKIAEQTTNFNFFHALGLFNNAHCFCAEIKPAIYLHKNLQLFSLKQAFEKLNDEWFSLIVKSVQIIDWDKNHQYCGLCGNKTKRVPSIFEAHCEPCNMVFYPRISPSIIVMIRKENQILMARGLHFPEGVYGLIAGFVSPGETLEDAIKREVSEEIGIKIKNIRYFGSQPWPFPDSLMVAFIADYDSGEIIIDNIEIIEADWYDINNLPGMPSSSKSIAKSMIDSFITEFA